MATTIWAPVNRSVAALRDRSRYGEARATTTVLVALVRLVDARKYVPMTMPEFLALEALEEGGLTMKQRGAFVPTGRAVQIVSSMNPELLSAARTSELGSETRLDRSRGLARGRSTKKAASRAKNSAPKKRTRKVIAEECACVCKCGKGLKVGRKKS